MADDEEVHEELRTVGRTYDHSQPSTELRYRSDVPFCTRSFSRYRRREDVEDAETRDQGVSKNSLRVEGNCAHWAVFLRGRAGTCVPERAPAGCRKQAPRLTNRPVAGERADDTFVGWCVTARSKCTPMVQWIMTSAEPAFEEPSPRRTTRNILDRDEFPGWSRGRPRPCVAWSNARARSSRSCRRASPTTSAYATA